MRMQAIDYSNPWRRSVQEIIRLVLKISGSYNSDVITIRFLVSGRVQGVGYRYSTRNAAVSLGIRGSVRNLANGSVEVVAQAEEENLIAFERFLREGPAWARVDEVIKTPMDTPPEYSDFQILF